MPEPAPGGSLLGSLPAGLVERVPRRPAEPPIRAGRPAGEVAADVDRRAAALAARGVAGEVVALVAGAPADWTVTLLALLAAGASPLLVAADAPAPEVRRLLDLAGGGRALEPGPESSLAGHPVARPGRRQAVLVPTSGSTGRPTLVGRSESSLLREGERYRLACGLDGADRVLLPLPLSHAYGLAWAVAALVAGAELVPLPATALGAVERELARGPAVLALVPTLARLLASRRLRRGSVVGSPPPRIAMVGAGPVDDRLEAEFHRAFGCRTARNYGSTETGTLFAGLPGPDGLPPLCVGRALSGIGYRVVGEDGAECPPGRTGALQVLVDGGTDWHATHDLACATPDGLVTILGRRSAAIRRGGRWVAPLEVEAVLRELPGVRDVRVGARGGRYEGEDLLVAEVERAAGGPDRDAVLAFARQRLAGYKVPDEVVLAHRIRRTGAGKATARPRYRLAGADAVAAAARAYKVAELLFALRDLGVLERLDGTADADAIAARLGLSAPALAWALEVAAGLGVLGQDPPAAAGDPEPYLALEARLSRGLAGRERIAAVLRDGRGLRHQAADGELTEAYQAAMNGPQTAGRTRLGLALARPPAGARILEVSAGPGRYLSAVLGRDPAATGDLVQLGPYAGPISPAVAGAVAAGRVRCPEDPAADYDLCVVANGVHGPHPGDDLRWLLDRLAPAGRLLVDDVFLPDGGGPGTELGLDWLTHGGLSWPTARALAAGIGEAGGTVLRDTPVGASACHLVLAAEDRP